MKNYLSLLSHGGKIGGSALGGAIGSLAGPGGTVLGAALGAAVSETCVVVLDDLANRYLSPKEQQRVAGVAALAIDGIRERLLFEGQRDDGFFESRNDSPTAAEELFEGMLLTAKQEHEQLKLPYLANFYTNLVFDSSVKRSEANYLLSLAESLTFCQFCLLGLVSAKQKTEFSLRRRMWILGDVLSEETTSIGEQAAYLNQRQLFYNRPQTGNSDQRFTAAEALPGYTRLSQIGQRLADLMCLHEIDAPELEAVAKAW